MKNSTVFLTLGSFIAGVQRFQHQCNCNQVLNISISAIHSYRQHCFLSNIPQGQKNALCKCESSRKRRIQQWDAAVLSMQSSRADLGLGTSNVSALLGSQGKTDTMALIPHLRGAFHFHLLCGNEEKTFMTTKCSMENHNIKTFPVLIVNPDGFLAVPFRFSSLPNLQFVSVSSAAALKHILSKLISLVSSSSAQQLCSSHFLP